MPVLTKINTNSIAEDAITGDKFAGDTYLANTATQNITGTYSESRLYTSDAYTLSGNTTVNSNVILNTVKGDDTDIVLTSGGAYTITGTGILEGGSLLSKQPTSVTGLASGELGSAVTGSPNLNLTTGTMGSGVTFPSGHVIQTVQNMSNYGNSDAYTGNHLAIAERGTNQYDYKGQIHNVKEGNHVLVIMMFSFYQSKASNDVCGGGYGILHAGPITPSGTQPTNHKIIYECDDYAQYLHLAGSTNQTYVRRDQITLTYLHNGELPYRTENTDWTTNIGPQAPYEGTNTYYLGLKAYASSSVRVMHDQIANNTGNQATRPPFVCILQEIQA